MSSSGMNGVERQIAMVDRYTKILSAFCEQGRYADLEHLKQQIDSFEDDRSKSNSLRYQPLPSTERGWFLRLLSRRSGYRF